MALLRTEQGSFREVATYLRSSMALTRDSLLDRPEALRLFFRSKRTFLQVLTNLLETMVVASEARANQKRTPKQPKDPFDYYKSFHYRP